MDKTSLVLFGASGLVGTRFIELQKNNFLIKAPDISSLDITDYSDLKNFLTSSDFNFVINFAAITNIDEAEKEKDNQNGLVYKVNVLGPKNLSQICKQMGKHIIQISTGYVFDGKKEDSPYTESDDPNPIGWYSKTKYLAEEEVKNSGCDFTIVRIEMPYSAHYELKKDVARNFYEQLKNGNQLSVVTDQKITPVLCDDIAVALTKIINKKATGIYHVTPPDWTTPFDFARLVAKKAGFDENLVRGITFTEYSNKPGRALRPKNTWLDCSKFRKEFGEGILHTIEQSLDIFKEQMF